jgi:hypothetical protein
VRAEERRLTGELARDAQDARLVGDVEPVAAFRFDGGGPVGTHLCEASSCGEPQSFVGCGAGRSDSRGDAAAGIGLAGHARGELGATLASEHEVRVAVDEARHDCPATCIDALVAGASAAGPTH